MPNSGQKLLDVVGKRTGPARGNQGAGVAAPLSLNMSHTPPVSGALGVIGLGGRTGRINKEVMPLM